MDRMKHCGTCRFWNLTSEADVGTCECMLNNSVRCEPPVGGLATYSFIYTHAVFGCVNHKEEINHE